jgi:putative hemolysin
MDSFDPLVCFFLSILSLTLTMLFSVAEQISFTARKQRIEIEIRDSFHQRWLSSLFLHSDTLISAIFIARCTSLVVAAICLPSLLLFAGEPVTIHPLAWMAGTVPCTIIIYIFSENISASFYKSWLRKYADFWTVFLWSTFILFYLPGKLATLLQSMISSLIGGRQDAVDDPLMALNSKNENREVEHELTIFQNALDFSKVKARDCMVPRTDIVAIDINSTMDELKEVFLETHFSKLLIYKDDSDNIIGYVHSHELFKKPGSIRNILLPVFVVPETINAREVFELFVKQKRSIAVVVDEFGGTAGMLTVEDVIEEIFGEIDDEHDTADLREELLATGEYVFSGRLEIDYLNEKYDLDLPVSDEYDTLAGLILHHLEDIPLPETLVYMAPYEFKVEQVNEARIEIIKVRVKDLP